MSAGYAVPALLVVLLGCDGRRHTTPVVYEVPDDFAGWVVIEFEVAAAPPLPVIGKERVVSVPRSGYLATSSRQEAGVLHQRYVAVDHAGRRTPRIDVSRDRAIGADAATRTYPEPVVCCWHSGVASGESGVVHKFEGFYMGRGPAGEPPDWPLTAP